MIREENTHVFQERFQKKDNKQFIMGTINDAGISIDGIQQLSCDFQGSPKDIVKVICLKKVCRILIEQKIDWHNLGELEVKNGVSENACKDLGKGRVAGNKLGQKIRRHDVIMHGRKYL